MLNATGFSIPKLRPTKRAPDAGDSAAIPSIFHALAFFRQAGFLSQRRLTRAVGTLHTQPGKIPRAMRNSSNTV